MLVETFHRFFDAEMSEQSAPLFSFFVDDDVSLFQRFNRPKRHILQITNRRRDEIQFSRHTH